MLYYVALGLLMPLAARAMPMFFLTKPNHCSSSVEISGDTLLTINWEAPEMDDNGQTDGEYYTFTVTPSGGSRGRNRRSKSRGNSRQVTSLKGDKKGKGKILYTSPEEGGKLDICIINKSASPKTPIVFGFSVMVGHDKSYYEQEAIDKHLSTMQVNLMKIKDEIEDIIREADYMKDTEKSFHKHSLSMHAASHWWPMIQTLVLLLTGVTTIMHMISFFNKRVF